MNATAETAPARTTSGCYPIRYRADLPRDVASDYWAGPHAKIAGALPHIIEYNQHHFSGTDRGYWPPTPTVGTCLDSAWAMDGMTEVRLSSAAATLLIPLHMRGVYADEQNVFDTALSHLTGPGGGRWWTTGHDDTIGHRTVLLLRRRRVTPRKTFHTFVHNQLGPALFVAGARDVRSYTFAAGIDRIYHTPGVQHRLPTNRRYHAAVVFGTPERRDLDDVISSPHIRTVIAVQQRACTAIHAHTVERTVPVIRCQIRDKYDATT